jgi:predicted small secreted protein
VTRREAGAVVLAAALLVAAPLTLTGCSTIEGVIEQQTGGDVDLGGTSVPEDFPAAVPLAEGEVVNGSAISNGDGKVWNVLIDVPDPSAPDSIAAQLEGAGFVSPDGIGGLTGEGGTLTYAKDDLIVNVLLAKSDDGWTANYTVARSAG